MLAATLLLFLSVSIIHASPLDDYINAPDDSYGYHLAETINTFAYTGYVLEMTSQAWRTSEEVNQTRWKHWVTIVVPTLIRQERAVMVIVGADNGDPYEAENIDYLAPVAVMEGAVTVMVEMVPNQPLTFVGENKSRSSDAIIAYSWDRFLETADPTWPAQLPMTKSVVRAMDAVQEFCAALAPTVPVTDFIVVGGSKHGWTTWLAAVVDERVAAAIPIVIDLLNMDKSFRHHLGTYGFWAPAIHDYADMDIFDHIGTPEMTALTNIVDPYVYRDRLTIPRFIVNSAGDEFFLPDSSQFYYQDLSPAGNRSGGGKYLRYVPNAAHSLDSAAAVETVLMYIHAALNDVELPEFTWQIEADGTLVVNSPTSEPSDVKLWQASNSSARDFRYSTIGSGWSQISLPDQGGGRWEAQVDEPAVGWTAYFIEMHYPGDGLFDYTFTTGVHVTPCTLPFSADVDCDGDVEGDMDGNGFVTLEDAVLALQLVSGRPVTDIFMTADYDNDSRLGLAECLFIMNWLTSH